MDSIADVFRKPQGRQVGFNPMSVCRFGKTACESFKGRDKIHALQHPDTVRSLIYDLLIDGNVILGIYLKFIKAEINLIKPNDALFSDPLEIDILQRWAIA
jgi:hypothetical protein